MFVVLPGRLDDEDAPSGGDVYNRRMCQELAALGHEVRETVIPGTWPQPDAAARARLAGALSASPNDSLVLLDGLLACGVPDIVVPQTRRLHVVVLVHLPLADETGLSSVHSARLDAAERECLHAVSAIVATSPLATRRLIQHHGLPARNVHSVLPGTDPAPVSPGTDGSSRLLCVASVTPRKGHDLLVEALATVTEWPWTCEFVGSVRRDSDHARRVMRLIERHLLADRVRLVGPATGEALASAYASADLFLLPSRAETYGMVVSEALARGIPVIASAVPDALGKGGLLLPPGDVDAVADGLRRWLSDTQFRRRLVTAAQRRRETLPTWATSASRMAAVLANLGK